MVIKLKVMSEKNRYSDEELGIFKALIEKKIVAAKREISEILEKISLIPN